MWRPIPMWGWCYEDLCQIHLTCSIYSPGQYVLQTYLGRTSRCRVDIDPHSIILTIGIGPHIGTHFLCQSYERQWCCVPFIGSHWLHECEHALILIALATQLAIQLLESSVPILLHSTQFRAPLTSATLVLWPAWVAKLPLQTFISNAVVGVQWCNCSLYVWCHVVSSCQVSYISLSWILPFLRIPFHNVSWEQRRIILRGRQGLEFEGSSKF